MNYRYESPEEETFRRSSLQPGYKILADPNPASLNFWDSVFRNIPIEDAQIIDEHQEEYQRLCAVIQVRSEPYSVRGAWFLPVYYCPVDEHDNIRMCELMFNNYHEAAIVGEGDFFRWDVQKIKK